MESKKLKCEICEKSFSRNDVKRHMNIVHGEKKEIECNICNRVFGHKHALKLHIENHHQNRKINHKCILCGKSFYQPGALKSHIKTIHESQKNYKCDSCENSFTTLT